MDEKKMFDEVRQLCLANGLAIDRIAHDCNINQNLVAKFFMEVMQKILDDVDNACKGRE